MDLGNARGYRPSVGRGNHCRRTWKYYNHTTAAELPPASSGKAAAVDEQQRGQQIMRLMFWEIRVARFEHDLCISERTQTFKVINVAPSPLSWTESDYMYTAAGMVGKNSPLLAVPWEKNAERKGTSELHFHQLVERSKNAF